MGRQNERTGSPRRGHLGDLFCAHQNFRQKCRSNPLRTQAPCRFGAFLVPPKIPPKEGWHPLAQ
jgi:hypothetical protein